jgi:hypothetical protein
MTGTVTLSGSGHLVQLGQNDEVRVSRRAAVAVAVAAAMSCAVGVALVVMASAGGATTDPEAGVRAAALKWEKVFLTGTPKQIIAMQGPECRKPSSTTAPKPVMDAYLAGLRRTLRTTLGVPLDEVPVRGVEVRDVTATRGFGQVLYDLPEAKAGNYNWVEFRLHGGVWKVSDCRSPITGHSSSATSAQTGT